MSFNPSHRYDKFGNLISQEEWVELFEEMDYRRVGGTETMFGYQVSTVWLGIDHNYDGGLPLIFETMVFNSEGQDMEMERYSTLEEAAAGHLVMAKKWRCATPALIHLREIWKQNKWKPE